MQQLAFQMVRAQHHIVFLVDMDWLIDKDSDTALEYRPFLEDNHDRDDTLAQVQLRWVMNRKHSHLLPVAEYMCISLCDS